MRHDKFSWRQVGGETVCSTTHGLQGGKGNRYKLLAIQISEKAV